ncbi:MAG: hypothetical protein AAF441_18660 [Pseudomonadota bacterium]
MGCNKFKLMTMMFVAGAAALGSYGQANATSEAVTCTANSGTGAQKPGWVCLSNGAVPAGWNCLASGQTTAQFAWLANFGSKGNISATLTSNYGTGGSTSTPMTPKASASFKSKGNSMGVFMLVTQNASGPGNYAPKSVVASQTFLPAAGSSATVFTMTVAGEDLDVSNVGYQDAVVTVNCTAPDPS